MSRTRRNVLSRIAVVSATASIAGCSISATYPDVSISNCTGEEVAVQLTIQNLESNIQMHRQTHTISETTCGEHRDNYTLEDVWESAGRHRIVVQTPDVETAETVTIDRVHVNDEVGMTIGIRPEGIRIT